MGSLLCGYCVVIVWLLCGYCVVQAKEKSKRQKKETNKE